MAVRLRERPGAVGLAGSADPFAEACRHILRAAHEALRVAGRDAAKSLRSRLDDRAADCRKLAKKLGDAADAPLDISADRRTVSDRLDLEEQRRQAAQLRADLDTLINLDIVERIDGEQTDADRIAAHFARMAAGRYTLTLDDATVRELDGRNFVHPDGAPVVTRTSGREIAKALLS